MAREIVCLLSFAGSVSCVLEAFTLTYLFRVAGKLCIVLGENGDGDDPKRMRGRMLGIRSFALIC